MKMWFTLAVGITLTLTILIGGCIGQQAEPYVEPPGEVRPPNEAKQSSDPNKEATEEPSESSLPIEKLEYIEVDVNKIETSEVSRPAVQVPYADTAIIGQVIENLGTLEIDNESYYDYLIDVDEYLFNPFADKTITVRYRVFETRLVRSYIPAVGENLLLLLEEQDDYFRTVFDEIYVVSGESVRRNSNVGEVSSYYAEIPLDEAIAKIKLVADTWADEEFTDKRKQQIMDIAFSEPGIATSLSGKTYEVTEVRPWLWAGHALDQILYAVHTYVPNKNGREYYFIALVNATQNNVEDILWDYYSEVEEKEQAIDVALSDTMVEELIGERGYEFARYCDVCWDSWLETNADTYYIYPKVTIELLPNRPVKSDVLRVFVDLDRMEVVKIFFENWLSPATLVSSRSDRDLTMTLQLPKLEYEIGENIEATLSLSCDQDSCLVKAVDGQFFDLMIQDDQGNVIYHWAKEHLGNASPYELPTVSETIEHDMPLTQVFQFSLESAGTYYVSGGDMPIRGFNNWDLASVYYDGSSTDLNTPSLIINVR